MLEVLKEHVPENAVDLCMELWTNNPFQLILKRKRESVLGDYRFLTSKKLHVITINNDLNKYAFLVTFLHEIAHQHTHIKYRIRLKPHGQEWKDSFKAILSPFMNAHIFPQSILNPLANYLTNPKATSCTDIALHKALRNFDVAGNAIYLADAALGQTFKFNKRVFVKEDTRRSRALCREVGSGRRYYISEAALVEQVGQMKLIF